MNELGFYLDGRKRTTRTWSDGDAKGVPVIVGAGIDGLSDAAFGFSSQDTLDSWLTKNGLQLEYQRGQALVDRSPRRLTREKEAAASATQDRVTKEYAAELTTVLRRAGISTEDPDAMTKFLTSYDPLTGPQIHSVLLWEHINQQGSLRYLPGGWSWPNFSWLGFNDKCSCASVFFGGIVLWEHSWFRGRRIVLFAYPGAVFNIHAYPFYFNDIASSANSW